MKIILVGFGKIMYMPYMNFYMNQLNPEKDEIHVIYWSRDKKLDASLPENVVGHAFESEMEDAEPLKNKIPRFIKYRKFAKRVLKSENPDLLVIMHSTPGVVLWDLLRKKYKKKYIFDYRDFTYENISIYKKIISDLTKNSIVTFVSSDGFRKVLPEEKNIYTSHNIMCNARQINEKYIGRNLKSEGVIKIGFWGLIRHYDINKCLIEKIANDSRFELHYFGRVQGRTEEFLKESISKYDNIFYHGEYTPEERYEFCKKIDIIHNMYDKIGTITYAMGNKYYDGLVFNMPQLCTKDTYMGDVVEEKGVGLACNPYEEEFLDKVYNYYRNLQEDKFEKSCQDELNLVLNQMDEGNKIIRNIIENNVE